MESGSRWGAIFGLAVACALMLTTAQDAFAQAPPQRPASELEPGPIPRLSDGKPNFQGSWYKWTKLPNQGGLGTSPTRGGGPPKDAKDYIVYGSRVPYRPEALRERKWLSAHEDLDGEPKCHLAGTPRVALGPPYPYAIIQDEKQIVIIYEYVHEQHIVPINNSPRSGARTWKGESRAHWEGDTLVIETKNYNGRQYMSYNEPISENAVVVERLTMTGPNTYRYDLTITDPQTYTEPFVLSLTQARQPDKDQLISYDCLEGENDFAHYTPEHGGASGLALVKQPATIYGCLRAEPDGKGDFTYTVTPLYGKTVKLTPNAALRGTLPEYMDREVKFDGRWARPNADFAAVYADVHATGCRWDGK
jgi:hypothetical protein